MKKNILIVGSGAREYAMGLALKDEAFLYFCPGNGATVDLGKNIDLDKNEEIIDFCIKNNIDLVVVGPEVPLENGLGDDLKNASIKAFAPSRNAARLETSKAFMKDFATRYKIPTAKYLQGSNLEDLKSFIDTLEPPIVLKADGLCAGKGVLILNKADEAKKELESILSGKSFGNAGNKVVVEEFLDGYELSVFALCDGSDFVLLPSCQDHKRLLDGDNGPNTGGMGAYTPTPMCSDELLEQIKNTIIAPCVDGCKKDGNPFVGVLFAGIMVVGSKPYLLEFNVRFGDPECEVLLPSLASSFLDILSHCVDGRISHLNYKLNNKHCLGVVLASENYPYSNSEKKKITISEFDDCLGHICFAGVESIDGELYASGGRVLVCVGVGESLLEARDNAYKICECVEFEGKQYRKDIGFRAL